MLDPFREPCDCKIYRTPIFGVNHIIQYYPILSNIIQYYPILSNIIQYFPIFSNIIHISILSNIWLTMVNHFPVKSLYTKPVTVISHGAVFFLASIFPTDIARNWGAHPPFLKTHVSYRWRSPCMHKCCTYVHIYIYIYNIYIICISLPLPPMISKSIRRIPPPSCHVFYNQLSISFLSGRRSELPTGHLRRSGVWPGSF